MTALKNSYEKQRECSLDLNHAEKGQIIKNTHHYRDRLQQVETLEAALSEQLGDNDSQRLCVLLRASSPKIYKGFFAGRYEISHIPTTTLCQSRLHLIN